MKRDNQTNLLEDVGTTLQHKTLTEWTGRWPGQIEARNRIMLLNVVVIWIVSLIYLLFVLRFCSVWLPFHQFVFCFVLHWTAILRVCLLLVLWSYQAYTEATGYSYTFRSRSLILVLSLLSQGFPRSFKDLLLFLRFLKIFAFPYDLIGSLGSPQYTSGGLSMFHMNIWIFTWISES